MASLEPQGLLSPSAKGCTLTTAHLLMHMLPLIMFRRMPYLQGLHLQLQPLAGQTQLATAGSTALPLLCRVIRQPAFLCLPTLGQSVRLRESKFEVYL